MWNLNVGRVILALLTTATAAAAVTVTVSATASHAIPTTLWGQMYEDISFSGDGGLYAELLRNRAFQRVTPGTVASLVGWQAVNGASIAVVAESEPVSNALPNALRLTVPAGSTAQVGVANTGYFGIKVTADTTYKASFHYRFPSSTSSGSLSATLSLQSTAGRVFGSTSVSLSRSTSWARVAADLTATESAGDTSNLFVISVDGAEAAGETVSLAMLSLFPPTFRGRENGLRIDLAEALEEMGPAFFRFPGGNNLEGQTVDRRWQWNATVGPLVDRPGRQGDWSYINTDGLGLLEYLEWCEDLNMIPIMGIWAGYALGGTSVPQSQLGPYIQQAADQINFVIGDPATSEAAALRARLGRPEPFALEYVEVGNEDFIGSAPGTYTYRWRDIVTALQAQFPDIHFIASTIPWNPVLTPVPTHYDVHVYQTPTWFAQNSFFYDDFQRNGTLYFEGEYAAISTNPNNIFGSPAQGRLVYPTMQSAAGEAAFMTGLERNSDIVFAAAYAPLIGHATNNQWTPNLLAFDAGQVYKSTSFYVQKFFSHNRGDEYIPSTLPARTGTLYWSVVRKTSTSEIIIKVINTAATVAPVTFELPFANVASTGTAEVLTGGGTTSNTPSSPNAIVPVTSTIATGQTFDYNAPPVSVSVLTFVAP
ncbi:unnamed protein product [Cyclocybe aegerita]|uniref:non-reducing end alpha-L-arabinofuranosidase n=1 Tax=Cyclocybe aegerita TaxID=1973307 RepID=A0A8S0WAC2_CYCAE|nr:unnamed protein product [Cyclocybe aegerita]